MLKSFVFTIVSEDQPGIIDLISNVVSGNQANWLESSFSQLAGKFAGVVRVQVSPDQETALIKNLASLEEQNIHIQIEPCKEPKPQVEIREHASFSALGPDRRGIVHEFSHAFTGYNINIENLETSLTSMPYSGEPLFKAEGTISIPTGIDTVDLESNLLKIADELGLDFSIQIEH